MPSDALIAFTTFPTPEAARAAVEDLVREGLAACGTIIPGATSIYRWQEAIEATEESLVLLKLAADRFEALEARLVERHAYDVPELVAVPLVAAHRPYLDWLVGTERTG